MLNHQGANAASTAITDSDAADFLRDVIDGLTADRKTLPCKYFYDERGSILFDKICHTQDYYVTRADNRLLEIVLPEVAELIGDGSHVVEFGSGAGKKIRTLLGGLSEPYAYTPLDISEEILLESSERLAQDFPEIIVKPVVADYTKKIDLNDLRVPGENGKTLVFFPGSTISNFDSTAAHDFLDLVRTMIGDDGALLIGVDLIKDKSTLLAAYNDSDGITAQFNKNLLHRINLELSANFVLDNFTHESIYNTELNRIEMHLISNLDQTVLIGNHAIRFSAGESIHTENSYKYSLESFRRLIEPSGLVATQQWTGPEGLFSYHYLTAAN